MSLLDIILSVILVLSFIYGLFIGFIAILIPLASLIITLLTTPKITILLLEYFSFYKDTLVFKIFTYLVIYIAIRIILGLFEKPMKKALKSLSLGFIEKLFGGLSSILITASIIVVIFYFVLSFINKDLSYLNSFVLNILFYYLSPIIKLIYL